jgi:hypothetical protein
MVPQNTAKHKITNMTLLNTNPLSLEVIEPIFRSDFKREKRLANKRKEAIKIKNTNPKNSGPKEDCAKECTDDITPLRVKNVPKMTRANVIIIRTIFHALSISLFSWIKME